MKTITIKQPFASLIIEGIKEYEFRTWKTKYRGDILIHAGKSIDSKAMEKYKYLNLDYKYGCIIGKCTITDCIQVNEEFKKTLKQKNDIVYSHAIKDTSNNLYAFKLENIKKINPIYINGKLSLWEYNYKD